MYVLNTYNFVEIDTEDIFCCVALERDDDGPIKIC